MSPLDGGLIADLVLAQSSSLYIAACSGPCQFASSWRITVDFFPTLAVSKPLPLTWHLEGSAGPDTNSSLLMSAVTENAMSASVLGLKVSACNGVTTHIS